VTAHRWGLLVIAGLLLATGSAGRAAPESRIVFAANKVGSLNGEVYRVDPDGRRVDLSSSPAADLYPVVSPDGKRVVFASTRGGSAAVYVVGIDGEGLRRVSPPLFRASSSGIPAASFAWAADGRSFATLIGAGPTGSVYVGDVSGRWRLLGRNASEGTQVALSPDGRFVGYRSQAFAGSVQVVSSTGRQRWRVVLGLSTPAWSADDRLAVSINTNTLRLYDSRGHVLDGYRGEAFAWSPNGDVLAVMNGKRLQLRRDGVGEPFVDVRLPKATVIQPPCCPQSLQWIGESRLRVLGGRGWIGYDVAHRRVWALPGAGAAFSSVLSESGAVAAQQAAQTRPGFTAALTLQRPGARAARTLTTATWCGDDPPFGSLQFVPHSVSVVYQSSCFDPNADLYSVDPDGSNLFQLTRTSTDERQPSLSPDGSTVAYVHRDGSDENCQGCPETLWRIPVGGGTPLELTSHSAQATDPFDDDPSWSPDGTQLLFIHAGFDNPPPTLTTIPASGGTVHSLGVTGEKAAWGPTKIAYVANVARLTIKSLDPQTLQSQTVATGGDVENGGVAWSADGRLAYLVYDGNGRASIVIVGSGAKKIALAPLLAPGSVVSGLAWSPDDSRFAFVATDANGIGEVYTVDTTGHGLSRLTQNIGAVSGGLSWR
jgi:Tol biopolymer transport system component